MNNTDPAHRKAVIGDPALSFWLYDSEFGFDLTHPPTPDSETVKNAVSLETNTLPVKIDPAKSALVIIDMQNFFLSPFLGRPKDSKGLQAQSKLLEYAIPAARKAGIRIVWMNWGLTEEEIRTMPPAILRAFGFETVKATEFESHANAQSKAAAIDSHGINEGADRIAKSKVDTDVETMGKNKRIYRGVGSEIGSVTLDDGTTIEAGRLLMRDQWNSDLTPELSAAYKEGLRSDPPDVWIHKNRMSGMWGTTTLCTEFLEKEGIKTLLLAGVNTDQCVGGSLQDAFSKGFDCILLTDGAATTSPEYSQQCIEFNAAKTWGFCSDCESLWKGVNSR